MAIAYAGGTLSVKTVVVGANCTSTLITDASNGIIAALTAAGWTITNHGQWNIFRGTGNPSNTQTVTIAARVYTFNTVLGGANSILIGANSLETMQNLKAAINGDAGVGVTYGIGTAVNTDVTAVFPVGTVSVNGTPNNAMTMRTLGASGIAASTTTGAYSWDGTNFASTLYKAVSAQTASFQKVIMYIGAPAGDLVTGFSIYLANRDSSALIGQRTTRAISNGQTYRTIAHRYGFHNHIVGTYMTRGTGIYAQCFSLPQNITPRKITAATNTTPIVITTDAAHGFVTGDSVFNKYVEGNTATNGTFTITVTGASTYSLDGSVGNGVFSGTDGLSQNLTPPRRTIMEFSASNFINNSSDEWIVSSTFYFGVGSGLPAFFGILDGGVFSNNATYNAFFPTLCYRDGSATLRLVSWVSGDYGALEPFVNFESLYGNQKIGPQVWNAFLAQNTSIAGGAAITADGHNWYGVYDNDTRDQLFLMVS